MKILRIISTCDPAHGGPIEGVFRVGEELARLGHVQDVMTLDPPDAPYVASAPARVFATGVPGAAADGHDAGRQAPLWRRFGYTPGAIPWIRAHRADYDAVIVSGLWNYAAVAARWGLVGGDTPYVVFTHGMLDPWFKQTYPLKAAAKQAVWLINEGPLLNNAHRVLFTSEEEKERARGVFRPYRVREEVVGYGTADISDERAGQDMAEFRAMLPALEGRRFLLFLSRIHEKKGCDLLVEAFADVAGQAPDLDLVIAGPDQTGLKAALQARAEARGVAGRIHWPGMLKGGAKWGAFRQAEAFVLPSHQENFGIVVAEALACGKPALISDKVNIWREVEADGAGLVEPDTLDGARALLSRFLALEDDRREAMGKNARACFLRRFDVRNAARDLEAVLAGAIANRRLAA
jgi:glycosyltransferase involved in cell wall biosynthesis